MLDERAPGPHECLVTVPTGEVEPVPVVTEVPLEVAQGASASELVHGTHVPPASTPPGFLQSEIPPVPAPKAHKKGLEVLTPTQPAESKAFVKARILELQRLCMHVSYKGL